MSDARLKGLATLVSLALLVVIVAGALTGSVSAADDLQARAEKALAAAGLDSVAVELEGREATVSGGTPDDLRRAELVVEGVDGVRWADVDRGPGAGPVARRDDVPTLDLRRTSGGISIAGTVPDADAAAGIKGRVAEIFGVPVTGDLTIDPVVGPATWVSGLSGAFPDLVGVKGLRITIEGNESLDVAGTIESAAGADRVRGLLASAMPDLDVVSRLDVVPGDLTEADAAVLNSSTLTFRSGSSRLEPAGRRTLDVVAAVLARNARVVVEVGGHAGPEDPVVGERLSEARVTRVKAYLERTGVEVSRISVRTYLADPEVAADPSGEQYRRVDFIVKEQ